MSSESTDKPEVPADDRTTSLPQIGAAEESSSPCEGCDGGSGGGRRGFLFAAGSTLLAVGGGLAAIPIVTVVIDPAEAPDPNRWTRVGDLDGFDPGTTVLVKFVMPWDSPTDGETNRNACYVRCIEEKKFQVFAINCAHLGCPVEWFAQSRLFMCPCHGGVYYEDGSRASGPPPRGLFEYEWRIKDDGLEILAGRLAGLQEGP